MDYWLTAGGGWDFDRYRATFAWDPGVARTSQSGRRALEPLRAATLTEWTDQAAGVRRALDAVLGTPPASTTPLATRVLGDEAGDGFRRLRVAYRADASEDIPAYLLLPEGPGRDETRRPAVICLHQTVPWGKREPCGLEGDPDLALALELVRRGFVCLTPDAICFGERYQAGDPYAHYGDAVAFFGRHPGWSVMGKMAYDVSRAVDVLQAREDVDPAAIGCIGHSHGAYGTLFAMLQEPRIRAGILSCGFTALRSDPNPERWWRRTALMPRLGWFEADIAQSPFDFHHLLALAAPRALYVSCALDDAIFPNTAKVPWMIDEARRVFALHGAAEAIEGAFFAGGHRFPRESRERAYGFLERRLS